MPNRKSCHWSDSGFLTEFEGEIFAQFADIQAQGPRLGKASISMPAKRKRWSGLVGTNGVLESNFDDGEAMPSTRVRSEWCIDGARRLRAAVVAARSTCTTRAAPRSRVRSRRCSMQSVAAIRFASRGALQSARRRSRRSVEHAAEPVFLTIMGESELFVQLPEHIAQASYHEPSRAAFGKPAVMWRGMMGTDGSFDAVMVDRASGKEVRRMPQRARIAWFAYAPDPLCAGKPVKLAERDGVVRDAASTRPRRGVLNDARQFRRIVRLGRAWRLRYRSVRVPLPFCPVVKTIAVP